MDEIEGVNEIEGVDEIVCTIYRPFFNDYIFAVPSHTQQHETSIRPTIALTCSC